jgi:mannose-1-phosphate guanylyltransferase/mannose-6-phosphate isomerase
MMKPTNNTLIIPVILCGGSGTRLWPLSRSNFPKQFLPLSGDGSNQSLFQQTTMRINAIGTSQSELGKILIVTNEEHRFLILDQLRELRDIDAALLLEPVSRNTTAALTLAAFQALEDRSKENKNWEKSCDPILVVTPADQIVQNQEAFLEAIRDCIALVADDTRKKTIAILGIKPKAPETGYGYIRCEGSKGKNNEFSVAKFVEKPDQKTAQTYFVDGNYLWNSGIFVLRASTWLAAATQHCPNIMRATEAAWRTKTVDESGKVAFVRPDKISFASIPSESIDYAVIEKCAVGADVSNVRGTVADDVEGAFIVKMVELDAGWSDLGAWDAVWQAGKQDGQGNVTTGDTLLADTKNSLVYSSTRLVGVVGVENLVIVETADAVLVADRKNSQDVKSITNQLGAHQREEGNWHRKVSRPWGWYDTVDEGERFKVKRIQVKPGARLSLQMHRHRAEHWIVVKGIAEITKGEKVICLRENESTYISIGEKHRLSNPGNELLEIIEVQSGSYLEEDDIVRFEDIYHRS